MGTTPLDEGSACRKDIHAPGEIRTRDPSKRSAADPCLRPLGNPHKIIRQASLMILMASHKHVFIDSNSQDSFAYFAWLIKTKQLEFWVRNGDQWCLGNRRNVVQIQFFWYMIPCWRINSYQRFGRACCFRHHGTRSPARVCGTWRWRQRSSQTRNHSLIDTASYTDD